MAKNKKSNKPRELTLKHVIFFLIAFTAIVSGGIYLKNYLDQRQIEGKYSVLEKDIKRLDTDTFKKNSYCYRGARKFQVGPLYCGISIENKENPKTDNKKIIDLLRTIKHSHNWYLQIYKSQTGGNYGSVINKSSGIKCNIDYRTDKNTFFYLRCFSESDSSFYPYRGD